jgi:hypothetical protein
MARHWKIAVAILAVVCVFGLMTLPSLVRSVLRLQRATTTEEQARRAITQSAVATPGDVRAKAQLFWASVTSPATLEPNQLDLPLSTDPVQRSRQLLTALIAQPPTTVQRTLPADTELLAFYLLPDGAAVADFSENLGTETPSGILSEQMAIDSIVRTLAANVPAIHTLKILIHGQEADTLAGHIDLKGSFSVALPSNPGSAAPAATTGAATTAPPAPPAAVPAAAPAAVTVPLPAAPPVTK